MTQYPEKPCRVCGVTWQPTNRYQSARNLTCSAECAAKSTSATKTGMPSPMKSAALTCPVCQQAFHRPPTKRRGPRPPACSRKCRGVRDRDLLASALAKSPDTPRIRVGLKGADNPAWKGGVTYRRGKGNYIGPRYVRCPPEWTVMARKDGYIMEHRLVMAQWVGRALSRTEVVNHLNHNPRDNRRENLELYPSNGDHKRGEVGRFVDGVGNRWLPRSTADRWLGSSAADFRNL